MFEKIFKNHIENHVNMYQISSQNQHGLRIYRSTSSNLIEFLMMCQTLLIIIYTEISASIIMYTDLKEAFDSVPHDLLLLKLSHYEITGKMSRRLKDFLLEREQRVSVGSALSESLKV